MAYLINGVVTDLGDAVERAVYSYRADTGALVGVAVSDPGTGEFEITQNYGGACVVVAMPGQDQRPLAHGPLDPVLLEVPTDITLLDTDLVAATVATAITFTAPGDAQVGDEMVVTFMHRAAPTAPAGWRRVVYRATPQSGYIQAVSVFAKTVAVDDIGADFTFSQDSDSRTAGALCLLRPANPPARLIQSLGRTTVIDDAVAHEIPPLQVDLPAAIALASTTCVYANVGGQTSYEAAGDNALSWQMVTPASEAQNRLAVARLDIAGAVEEVGERFSHDLLDDHTGGDVLTVWGDSKAVSWTGRQTITIPAATAAADLQDFPVRITDAVLDAALFAAARTDGLDIVVSDDSGNRLHREVSYYNAESQRCSIHVRVPEIAAGADTPLYVHYGNAQARIENDNDVWAADEVVLHLDQPGFVNSVDPDVQPVVTHTWGGDWRTVWFVRPVATSPDVDSHQGVATDGAGTFWTIDTDRIDRRDASWSLLAQNTTPFSGLSNASINHLSCGAYHDGKLYIPLSQWNGCGDWSDLGLAIYDATTLALISDTYWPGETTAYADAFVDGAADRIYFCEYCTGAAIHVHRLSDLAKLGTTPLSRELQFTQGITRLHGRWYLAGHDDKVWEVLADGRVLGPVYAVDPALISEGIDTDGTDLFFLTDGGAGSRVVTTLRPTGAGWFDNPNEPDTEGAVLSVYVGEDAESPVSMRVWFKQRDDAQRGLCSWTQNIFELASYSNARDSITVDDGDKLGTWNSDGGSWLYTGIDPPNDTLCGASLRITPGDSRTVAYNGTSAQAQGNCPSVPEGYERDYVMIGAEDGDGNEQWHGEIAEFRFSRQLLSDAWIDFEDANYRDPGSTLSLDAVESGEWAA